jgi:ABC-type amino acid transport substrate-binding protein
MMIMMSSFLGNSDIQTISVSPSDIPGSPTPVSASPGSPTPVSTSAAPPAFKQTRKFRVAVLNDALPYATCGGSRDETAPPKFEGVAVALFRKIAEHYDWEYEFICVKRNYDQTLEDIRDGKYDIGVADFSVISRRFDWVLYTRPYYVAGLRISRSAAKSSGLPIIFESQVLHIVLIAVGILILFFTLINEFAKKVNFLESLYKTFISFFINNSELINSKDNKRLPPVVLRPINTFWIVLVFLFRAFVISQIVSAFVQVQEFISEDELRSVNKVNVIKGTSFVDYAKQQGMVPVENEEPMDIVRKIQNSTDEYWFDDPIIMRNLIKQADKKTDLHFTSHAIVNDEYSLAVSKELPQVKALIDRYIVELQDSGDLYKICKVYLDTDLDRCIL